MLNVSPVWHANYNSKAHIAINQGGTDSGKTYAIMQLLFWIACTEYPKPLFEPVITIVSESVPNLKKGAYRAALSIINSTPLIEKEIIHRDKTDRVFTFKKGWTMEFVPALDEQAAKQGKRSYLFANEANGIPWLVFWQMAKRTRIRTFIDYNPSAPFWAHEKLIGTTRDGNDLGADVDLFISDHRHNPFLTEEEHRRTESIKDKELWRVYARGLTGNVEGLIYPNVKQIPDADFPKSDYFWGLDIGYTNDPTALIKECVIGNNLFLHECCYETGLAPRKVKEIAVANGYTTDEIMYCEHDKDFIRELRGLGVVAIPANKGQGSLSAGISKMKEYNIFITASSKNLHMERTKYMWIIDPITGKPTNTPIDAFNHGFDGARYGLFTKFFRQGI